jgi:hypothetical protein
MVRNSKANHLRLRPSLHVTLLENPLQQSRRQPKSIYGIPSPDRWTDRADERMGRTIPVSMDHGTTEQLGKDATDSRIRAQLLET